MMGKGLSSKQKKHGTSKESNLKKTGANRNSARLSRTLGKVRTLNLELFLLLIVIIFYRTGGRCSSENFTHETN